MNIVPSCRGAFYSHLFPGAAYDALHQMQAHPGAHNGRMLPAEELESRIVEVLQIHPNAVAGYFHGRVSLWHHIR
jgi:hypothetical protein